MSDKPHAYASTINTLAPTPMPPDIIYTRDAAAGNGILFGGAAVSNNFRILTPDDVDGVSSNCEPSRVCVCVFKVCFRRLDAVMVLLWRRRRLCVPAFSKIKFYLQKLNNKF